MANKILISPDKEYVVETRPGVTIDPRLDSIHERDRNSPFIQRKMVQAIAFLNEHGLPEGWGEWKKIEMDEQSSGAEDTTLEKQQH